MAIDLYDEDATGKLSDLDLITAVLDDMSTEGQPPVRPPLVTTVDWFMLHSRRDDGYDPEVDMISANDLVGDIRFPMGGDMMSGDRRHVLGFKDDAAGMECLQILNGHFGGYDEAYRFDQATGSYKPFQLGPSPHAVDLSNPMEVANVVDDFMIRNRTWPPAYKPGH